MKALLTNEPLDVTITKPRWDTWRARSRQMPGKSADSVCGAGAAADNLAARWFFGQASGLGPDRQRLAASQLTKEDKDGRSTWRVVIL